MINWTTWKNLTVNEFTAQVLQEFNLDIPVVEEDDGANTLCFIDGLTEKDEQWVVEQDPYLRVPPATTALYLKIERFNPSTKAALVVMSDLIADRMPEKAVKKSRLKPDQLLMLFIVLHEIGLYLDFKGMPLEDYIQKGLDRFAYMDDLSVRCSAMPTAMGQKVYAKESRRDPLEAAGDSYALRTLKAYLRTF
ncbi:MAG: hypothetical protein Q4E12_02270 [Coriobacteriia bacterium]|nr:hypothetical protein [Coriobacteriia bacterium]